MDVTKLLSNLGMQSRTQTLKLAPDTEFLRFFLKRYRAFYTLANHKKTRNKSNIGAIFEPCFKHRYQVLEQAGQHKRVSQRSTVQISPLSLKQECYKNSKSCCSAGKYRRSQNSSI